MITARGATSQIGPPQESDWILLLMLESLITCVGLDSDQNQYSIKVSRHEENTPPTDQEDVGFSVAEIVQFIGFNDGPSFNQSTNHLSVILLAIAMSPLRAYAVCNE